MKHCKCGKPKSKFCTYCKDCKIKHLALSIDRAKENSKIRKDRGYSLMSPSEQLEACQDFTQKYLQELRGCTNG